MHLPPLTGGSPSLHMSLEFGYSSGSSVRAMPRQAKKDQGSTMVFIGDLNHGITGFDLT
jgi:hypothetical protein